MADTLELVALSLPRDMAPETLPATVRRLVADCWPGMSRAQLVARARRPGLRPSLRAQGASAPDEVGRFALSLTAGADSVLLVAHLRRLVTRRGRARTRRAAAGSRPPLRDPPQTSLF